MGMLKNNGHPFVLEISTYNCGVHIDMRGQHSQASTFLSALGVLLDTNATLRSLASAAKMRRKSVFGIEDFVITVDEIIASPS